MLLKQLAFQVGIQLSQQTQMRPGRRLAFLNTQQDK